MNYPRAGHAAVLDPTISLYVVGGFNTRAGYRDEAETSTLGSAEWEAISVDSESQIVSQRAGARPEQVAIDIPWKVL